MKFIKSTQSKFEDVEAKRYEEDTHHRKVLVWWVIVVTSVWLVSIIALLWTSAFVMINFSDKVYITLLATTTINVLGLPLMI